MTTVRKLKTAIPQDFVSDIPTTEDVNKKLLKTDALNKIIGKTLTNNELVKAKSLTKTQGTEITNEPTPTTTPRLGPK